MWYCYHDKIIAKVQSVHIEQRQMAAADSHTKPTDLGCESACGLLGLSSIITIHHHHLVLLSPKADTHSKLSVISDR